MRYREHSIRTATSCLALWAVWAATMPASSSAAVAQPTGLSITPSSFYQGQCYTMSVAGGAHMTLDYVTTVNGGPEMQVTGFPSLDDQGRAKICTTETVTPGTWRVKRIRTRRTRSGWR